MKVIVRKSPDKLHFEGENEKGSKISIGASKDIGGTGEGTRPMDLVLHAIAGCASIDVCMILEKQRQIVEDYTVFVEAKRADAVPAVFETVHLLFSLTGDLDENKVQRAVALSVDKYCSVADMLKDKVKITYSIQLNK